MNIKNISIICTLAASATLSGCSATKTTDAELSLKLAEPFEDYNLSHSDADKTHSTAMQYMHLLTRARVYKANDIDANMDGYTNVGVRSTQALAATGVLIGSLNPFQAVFSMIGSQSNLSKLHRDYRQNTLFVITPLPSLSIEDVTKETERAKVKLGKILRDAYSKDGSSVTAVNSLKANWLRSSFDYLIPINPAGDVADCYNPDTLKNIQLAVAKEDYSPRYSFPRGADDGGCFSRYDSLYKVYESDGDNGDKLPAGNFVITSLEIPAIFPIDKLSTSEQGIYLYQPPLDFLSDGNLNSYVNNDRFDELSEYFKEEGIFRITPLVTKLSTGEHLEFGFVK
jgi:hypothetical protein